jgi:spore coat protein A
VPATVNWLDNLTTAFIPNDPTEETGLPGVTTTPKAGDVEDWLLVNTTADTHPIHLHLVHFEVADRRPFNAAAYLAALAARRRPVVQYTGPAVPANANENGLKDTVQANPGEVTRIRARFDLPAGAPKPAQYVWHCHILEHEENEMMQYYRIKG